MNETILASTSVNESAWCQTNLDWMVQTCVLWMVLYRSRAVAGTYQTKANSKLIAKSMQGHV